MFISNDYCGSSFRTLISCKLIAIANDTHVARIWMEQVDGPILCFLAIVSEGADYLKFYRPLIWD